MKSLTLVLSFLAIVAYARAQISIDDCLKKDSISCIQKTLFKKAREFFDRDSFEIVAGVSLVKGKDGRASRTGKELMYEQQIDKAENVVERQSALEKFLGEEVSDFVQGRSLKINFNPIVEKIGATARAATEMIPAEIRQAADEVVEGRGKKKFMKHLMPLLLAAKVKVGLLATLAFFGIALLAKKAIVASVISIAISTFLGLKSLWHHKHHGHHDHHHHEHHDGTSLSQSWSPPSGGSGGWSAGYGDDAHGAYSGQSQTYTYRAR